MIKTVHQWTATAALALALAPVALADDPAGAGASEPAPACVSVRDINGYAVLDDRHLLLSGGVSDHYLVTTRTRCSGMRAGAQVGLSFADTSRICRPTDEFIIPDDGWRCAIATIEEVADEDAARALITARTAEAIPE